MTPTRISDQAVVLQADDQVSCILNDEAAVLSIRSATYFGLDETGAFLWQRLAEPCTIAGLCEALAEAYDITHAECLPDVVKFVTDLREAGLVTILTQPD